MVLLEVIKAIKDTYSTIPLVNSVYDNSNLINRKDTKYINVSFDLQSVNEYENYSVYNFNITASELMSDKENLTNQHYSTLVNVIREGFDLLQLNYDIDVDYPINYQMNTLKFADVLDIVQANVNIITENTEDC